METQSLTTLTSLAKSGDSDAQLELVRRFLPLMKKYAAKCYTMEFEDALQEFILAFLNSIRLMKYQDTEAAVIAFFQHTIINHYKYLCRKSILLEQRETLQDTDYFLSVREPQNPYHNIDFQACMEAYIKTLPEMHGKILKCILDGADSDTEIARKLHVSRQYVNRIKKKFVSDLKKQLNNTDDSKD